MKKLSQRHLALIGLAVDRLIDGLEVDGDEYDVRDLETLKEASQIINAEITK